MHMKFALLGACAATMALTAPARAEYPEEPVTLVIPFGAGGITDLVTRRIAEKMAAGLGTDIIVENRPGAGGTIAARSVAESDADGYTVFVGTVGSQVVNPLIRDNVGYDPVESFEPVGLMAGTPFLLAVNPGLGVETFGDLVTYAKEHPGELNFGSAGVASSPHLGLELLKYEEGIDIVHIPFNSGREAVNAAASNEVDMTIDAAVVIMPQVKEGLLVPLMLGTDRKMVAAPDVPTNVEAGAPEISITSWNGLFVPSGTPEDVVSTLNTALMGALSDEELIAALEAQGTLLFTGSMEEYDAFIEAERTRWSTIVEAADISIN
ncbi:tripartite tricarboxylate transporter substrate binding protein [Salipiger thiooxidans]|uniref:Bug family tripartite tricarboxylate transporter substrate binding protein n=1 Tax=Salipiger thiooxidans TaxID=282683 RepID=UPI001A9026B2|nr:tripartite tricarboxylate transporter substrate binding protein [Salipiger thiooxidans]MBN8188711.1 tripartite tricarboxylate transporter substrate binding protein [Salipiger thiooxidans]